MTAFGARTLRESKTFTEQRDQRVGDAETWDALWTALSYTVALKPTIGYQIGETPYWMVTTYRATAWGLPRMRVLYSFDDQYVDLIDLDLAE